MTDNVYLVTGAMGCIGAWSLHHLVKAGKKTVSFDLSDDRSRIDLLLSKEEQETITFAKGDITDPKQVADVFSEHGITHVIHLAALQVPACKANPVLGARVNVVGTVNVFEAARINDVKHVGYASSVAVYGAPEDYPSNMLEPDAPFLPRTLYGVYKVANEGTAKVYWYDHGISSTVLRPYTVYGVGRDQGLTSEPTKAMLAAAAGKSFHISFGGAMQFHFASDVARQFIEAAEYPLDGAYGFSIGTPITQVDEVVRIINEVKPGVNVTNTDVELPFPDGTDGTEYKKHLNRIQETLLEDGVRQTIEHFEKLLSDNKLTIGD